MGIIPITILAAAVGCAHASGATGGAVNPAEELVQIEHDWGDALLKQDAAAFGRCLGDDWTLTTSEGAVITKPIALADVGRGELRIKSFRLGEVKVRVYGDAAVVIGLIDEKSTLRGVDTSGRRRFTDVFVKRDGRWQAVASHESPAGTR